MYRVLLVEDSAIYQRFISQALGAGFEVTIARGVKAAEEFCKQRKFDILIVDVVLPDGSGVDFCHDNRELDCPVVMLTSAANKEEKILGWKSGVDDYITKPIDPLELRTRVLARVQKFHFRKERGEILIWSDLELNLTKHSVTLVKCGSRTVIEITPYEFKILHSLIRHEGRTLDRIKLKQLVWGNDIHIAERTIDRHISTIRKKLGQHRDTILTIPGEGYRLADSQDAAPELLKKSS